MTEPTNDEPSVHDHEVGQDTPEELLTTQPEDDDPRSLAGEIVPDEELQFDEDTDVDPELVELPDED